MRSLPVPARVGLLLNTASLVMLIVAFAKRDDVAVEGAYFNRSVGAPAYAGVFSASPAVTPWLVAGAILLVVGTSLLVLALRRGSVTGSAANE